MIGELLPLLGRGTVVVTVNSRLARDLRAACDRHQRASRAAWAAAPILPWTSWLDSSWRAALPADPSVPTLLSATQELLLWETAIRECAPDAGAFDYAGAAALASAAWRLIHEWSLPSSVFNAPGHPDGEAFAEWAACYLRHTARIEATDRARWPRSLPALWDAGSLAAPARLVFAGFDSLTPEQQELAGELTRRGADVVHLVGAEPDPGSVSRMALPDGAGEVEAAARWARRILDAHPKARIGVVFVELPRLRNAVERVFSRELGSGSGGASRFHISLGPPLDSRPLVASALAIAATLLPTLPFETASRLLLNPFLAAADSESSARALFELELRRRNLLNVSLASLASLPGAPPAFRELCLAWDSHRCAQPARQPPGAWARAVARQVQLAGWPGERPLSSVEFQVRERWRELLAEFASLDLVAPPLDCAAALAELARLARSAAFEVENRDEPVQIMGPLEASQASFDFLWVANLDDTIWPPPPAPNPFIAIGLQRRHGVPHSSAAQELAFARRVTALLAGAAREVVFSHPVTEGDVPLSASPLIREWPLAQTVPAEPPRPLQAPFEELDDRTGPPVEDGGHQPGGARILKLQAACPFRAFAELRLLAVGLDEPEVESDPRERGLFLHAALDRCWARIGSSRRLRELDLPARRALVEQAVEAALPQSNSGGDRLRARFRQIERDRLVELLLDWLEVEEHRAVEFTVEAREAAREIRLGPLQLRTRIDRVDRLPDGRAVLIDYKSSDPGARVWEGERPDEPQLPLYTLVCGEPVAAVLFAALGRRHLGFRGLSTVAGLAPGVKPITANELADQISSWRSTLERLASEFAAGQAPVDPKPLACRTCDLALLCRIRELSPAGPETAG